MSFQMPSSRYILPSFVERTSYGMKESNPYNKLFEERIIFLGVQIDDASANDVMAQLITLESTDPDRDITIYINSPGGSFTSLMAIYDTMMFVRPEQYVVTATACGRRSPTSTNRGCRRKAPAGHSGGGPSASTPPCSESQISGSSTAEAGFVARPQWRPWTWWGRWGLPRRRIRRRRIRPRRLRRIPRPRRQMDRPDPGLEKLAAESGGGYFELTSTNDLASTFSRVADELHHQYVLGFEPEKLDGKMHKLEVRIKQTGMTPRARHSYVAAKPEARQSALAPVLNQIAMREHRD